MFRAHGPVRALAPRRPGLLAGARVGRRIVAVATAALALHAGTARASDEDPWLGRDKALHFGASAVIAGGTYALSALWIDGRNGRAGVATGVALGAGVSKELYDLSGRGDPSFRDLAWDVIGTAFGVGLSVLIDLAVRGGDRAAPPTSSRAGALVRW